MDLVFDFAGTFFGFVAGFNPFRDGVWGACVMFIFFYVFCYAISRGSSTRPHEESIELIVPFFLITLFLNFINASDMIIGLVGIFAFIIWEKYLLKEAWKDSLVGAIKLWFFFGLFSILDLFVRWTIIAMYIGYLWFSSDKQLAEKAKAKKEKKK